MDFAEYERAAARTAHYKQDTMEYKLMLLSMGLAGEAGEAIDKIKKLVDYQDGGTVTDEKRKQLVSELGGCAVVCVTTRSAARFVTDRSGAGKHCQTCR